MILEKSTEQRSVENSNSKVVVAREKKDQQNRPLLGRRESVGTKSPPVQDLRGPYMSLPFIKLPRDLLMEQPPPSQRTLPGMLLPGPRWLTLRRMLLNLVKTLVFLLLRSPLFSLQPMPSMMTPRRTWACKELISHLATPIEEEFLGGLSNVEVVRRAYQSLGRCVLSQGELLKRHEKLNRNYVDLRNHSDTQLEELNRLRTDLQRQMQTNDGLSKQFVLLDKAHLSCPNKEKGLMDKLRDMEKEGDD
ncbi:hypothetical protein Tco_0155402 [Tanacetum coccineum]